METQAVCQEVLPPTTSRTSNALVATNEEDTWTTGHVVNGNGTLDDASPQLTERETGGGPAKKDTSRYPSSKVILDPNSRINDRLKNNSHEVTEDDDVRVMDVKYRRTPPRYESRSFRNDDDTDRLLEDRLGRRSVEDARYKIERRRASRTPTVVDVEEDDYSYQSSSRRRYLETSYDRHGHERRVSSNHYSSRSDYLDRRSRHSPLESPPTVQSKRTSSRYSTMEDSRERESGRNLTSSSRHNQHNNYHNSYYDQNDEDRDRSHRSARSSQVHDHDRNSYYDHEHHSSSVRNKYANNDEPCSSSRRHRDEYSAPVHEKSSGPRKRRLAGGEWEEHVSSSNKTYFYNRVNGVSQWDKPKEVIELERTESVSNHRLDDRDADHHHTNHRRSRTSRSPFVDDKLQHRAPQSSREKERPSSYREDIDVDMELEEVYHRKSRRRTPPLDDREPSVRSRDSSQHQRTSSNHVVNNAYNSSNHHTHKSDRDYPEQDRYSRLREDDVDYDREKRRHEEPSRSSHSSSHYPSHLDTKRSVSLKDRDNSARSLTPLANNSKSPTRDRYYESRDRSHYSSSSRIDALKRKREEETRSVTPTESRKRRSPDRVPSSYKNYDEHRDLRDRYDDKRSYDYESERQRSRHDDYRYSSRENGRLSSERERRSSRYPDEDPRREDDRKRRKYGTPTPPREPESNGDRGRKRDEDAKLLVDETTQSSTVNDQTNHSSTTSACPSTSGTRSQCLSPSQVTMDNLEQIIDSLADTPGLPDLRKLSREDALKTIQQVLKIMKEASLEASNGHQKSSRNDPLKSVSSPKRPQASSSQSSSNSHQYHRSSARSSEANLNGGVFIHRQDLTIPSPSSEISGYSSTRGSPSDSGVDILAPSKLSVPSLTTTLQSCYREDIIKHVQGWPAEHFERQVSCFLQETKIAHLLIIMSS